MKQDQVFIFYMLLTAGLSSTAYVRADSNKMKKALIGAFAGIGLSVLMFQTVKNKLEY